MTDQEQALGALYVENARHFAECVIARCEGESEGDPYLAREGRDHHHGADVIHDLDDCAADDDPDTNFALGILAGLTYASSALSLGFDERIPDVPCPRCEAT